MTHGNSKNKNEYSIKFKLSFCDKCQVFPFIECQQTNNESHYVTKDLFAPLTKCFKNIFQTESFSD